MASQAVSFNGLLSENANSNHTQAKVPSAFSVMVRKDVGDIVHSWRFIILSILILLTFIGSMYVSMSNIAKAVSQERNVNNLFVYLKLLTTSDGSMPTFHVFISFLGPLLGIALGFDAVNSEQANGTLIRLMAQPVYRDNILLSKFASALIVVAALFLSLCMLMVGAGMLETGVPIEPSEIVRILFFVLLTVLYVGFWLTLSIFFSLRFRQTSTSALAAIAVWLFFTVFYPIILQIIAKAVLPDPATLSQDEMAYYNSLIMGFLKFIPNQLYTDAATTLLMPSVRSLGTLTMEQIKGAVPSPLSTRDSIMIVWPQISGLLACTILCFAWSYSTFMRREIRN
ncbi:MAG: ABC transporter permease subunit [Chitinophagaceae bacterium]